ncbi:hypothetical protein HZC32_00535 [Candidatus Woesearchaeota archaeon]|nr:hypothetical protein [Candidatus Woesearchaeota archaeon]
MLELLLNSTVGKFVAPLVMASILSAPAYASLSQKDLTPRYSLQAGQNPESRYHLTDLELEVPTELEKSGLLAQNDPSCPPYLPSCQKKQSPNSPSQPSNEPNYNQPSYSPSYTPPAERSSGCGSTCTVIGGVTAGICGSLFLYGLISMPRVKKEQEENCAYAKSWGGTCDSVSYTGIILLGVCTAAGLGLTYYGVSTSK